MAGRVTRGGAAVTAHARITAAHRAPGGAAGGPPAGTVLPVLRGDGPLALRRTRAPAPFAQVTVVGAMSAPLGGDRLRLSVEVGPRAALRVTSAAATLALPGRRDPAGGPGHDPAGAVGGPPRRRPDPARYDTELTVGADAELHWLPEPLISARGSDLVQTTRVTLAPTARLVHREQQVLGRHGEEPGRLLTRLVVHRDGRPLLDQELSLGSGAAPGWDGGAVLGGHRAVGQLLVVDPAFAEKPPEPVLLGDSAALTPLAGPAALVTALAPDALTLGRLLAEGAALL
ncbi:urease accessory protein UreD [Streptomyces sp. 4N509B]|uniref:urease accessory protein UreD n=1 Tax=Streptomyces sp. 4N509B TaxID=3457413 RepID=UPI003FD6B9FD